MTIVKKFTESRNEQMNWKVVEKHSSNQSKYRKFYEDMVIFLPRAKHPRLVVTPDVHKALGKPSHVVILVNMPFIALQASNDENPDAYSISSGAGNGRGRMFSVSCSKFLKDIKLAFPYSVYYECVLEDDLVYFDSNKPCKV